MVEDGTVMRGRVTVYSVPGCPHCIQAKATLSMLGVPVCDVNVNKHRELRARLKKLTGLSVVPQIFFNNLYVGNNEDLQNLDPERLERLVLSVREEPVPLDAPPVPGENSLDSDGEVYGAACELSEALRNLILKLYSDHLSEDGKTVDYKAMSRSLCFERYCDLAVHLQRVELLSLSREEKLAFFINIYNALVIHGNLRLGFPKNIWQRYRFFNYVSYFIGGEVFTLQDIENGVLRGNRKGVAQLMKPFSRNDPRLQVFQDEDANFVPTPDLPKAACELSEALRNLILKLYSDHLSEDGKTVDYKAMSRSLCFERYCDLAVHLQRVELLSLSREEKLAFFINIYNALVIHGNLRLGFPKNIWQRYRFFNYVSYFIGGEVFTLQDIENGVLRGNRKGVAHLLKPFSRNDPRLQVALPDVEPHSFALNCGAKGCPPIKTYTPQIPEVKLSQIFKWYKADFGGTDEKLLNWVFDHMGASQKKRNLQALLSEGKVKVSYLPITGL
ncbi:uncharacterized protein LOC107688668 [Sinocyclocheilus anshuiensis]|uniref:uncharacterized protein LOC107688668 n=1 Tax=Sinocyclocheilus anshuiensis TaxID=1608454 RepID=UPI0007BA1762|nr:PREDICTED: uncharacterized protein LOC107688668 [Sinocyclocheilus anshuiensis]